MIIEPTKKESHKMVALLLMIMAVLMLSSSLGDSATTDERAHIPAAYSYLALKDYRLNPEHPPLIKDLAGLPLLLYGFNFPTNTAAWSRDLNGQWAQGTTFLYDAGNNPDLILFWSRIPIMALAIFFGWLIWSYARKKYNDKVALLVLFLYSFSPTFIAHSRLVTTDLGAAFGFFIGLVAFLKFLEHPSGKKVALAGLALGAGLLLKFSLFLLIILQVFLIIIWVIINPFYKYKRFNYLIKFGFKYALIGLIAWVSIWPVYQYHVWNYPAQSFKTDGTPYSYQDITNVIQMPDGQARWDAINQIPLSQKRDTMVLLGSFGGGPDPEGVACNPQSQASISRRVRCLAEVTIAMSDKPVLRPWAQWSLGFLMVLQRSSGGNTGFFLGEVSAAGWKHYFPVLYIVKEPLAFHILTLLAFSWSLYEILKRKGQWFSRMREWLASNFSEFAFVSFIALYWISSIRSPLNIGIRHILPTFPFLYMLVAHRLIQWAEKHEISNPQSWWKWLREVWKRHAKGIFRYSIIAVLLLWLAADTLIIYPYFITYFNELVGGPKNGYKVVADSNLDWGQDLKRLKDFADQNGIERIAIEYFGGGEPRYYFGDRAESWWSAKGEPKGWFAISATLRQGALGQTAPGFIRRPEDSYLWLRNKEPVATVGHSIFVYYFPEN